MRRRQIYVLIALLVLALARIIHDPMLSNAPAAVEPVAAVNAVVDSDLALPLPTTEDLIDFWLSGPRTIEGPPGTRPAESEPPMHRKSPPMREYVVPRLNFHTIESRIEPAPPLHPVVGPAYDDRNQSNQRSSMLTDGGLEPSFAPPSLSISGDSSAHDIISTHSDPPGPGLSIASDPVISDTALPPGPTPPSVGATPVPEPADLIVIFLVLCVISYSRNREPQA